MPPQPLFVRQAAGGGEWPDFYKMATQPFHAMQSGESIPVRAEAGAADVRLMETESGVQIDAASDSSPEVGGVLIVDPQPDPLQNQTEEENEMIDVHAPHGGLHTWKDFWIHLGTITLGLLIAISLEQTVEYFHHLHQRHQLEEDLRAEAKKNLAIMDGDYTYLDLLMANTVANRERVDAMRAGYGKIKLSFLPFKSPRANGVGFSSPQASVWTTAKESEQVSLLPREEAKFYNRVYRQYEILMSVIDREQDVAFDKFFLDAQAPAPAKNPWDLIDPDLSHMSAQQLDDESTLLAKHWAALRLSRLRVDFFYSAESAVLNGGVSDESVLSNMLHRPLTVLPAQPDAVANPSAKPEHLRGQ